MCSSDLPAFDAVLEAVTDRIPIGFEYRAGGATESRPRRLEPCGIGDSLITRFPHLEPLGSRVCWAEGTTTGVQFLTSIHPAVFDMLLSRLSEDAVAA